MSFKLYLSQVSLNANIREDEFRHAINEICYLGISSCIIITFVTPAAIIGMHCTILTELTAFKEALSYIQNHGPIISCYVIGAISTFKLKVKDKNLCTRNKISRKIKEKLPHVQKIYFHDITFL